MQIDNIPDTIFHINRNNLANTSPPLFARAGIFVIIIMLPIHRLPMLQNSAQEILRSSNKVPQDLLSESNIQEFLSVLCTTKKEQTSVCSSRMYSFICSSLSRRLYPRPFGGSRRSLSSNVL